MAGQQFQYDDSGNTFFYFLTSFVGLIVIPATYYLWPRDQNAGESRRRAALARSGGRSAPIRAAPSCPPVPLRVPVTPPGRRGLRAAVPGAGARRRFPGQPAGPPFCVLHGSLAGLPSALFWTPLARRLFVSPASAFVGCFSFFLEGAGWAGTGGERRVGRGGRGACGHNSASFARATLPSLSSRCPRCSCRYRCLGGTPELGGMFGTSK